MLSQSADAGLTLRRRLLDPVAQHAAVIQESMSLSSGTDELYPSFVLSFVRSDGRTQNLSVFFRRTIK